MKIIQAIIISFFITLISSSVSAHVGDIAGQYYWTDISTILNGYEIDSININGQTLISAEDMSEYGFWVKWYADQRILDIDYRPNFTIIPPHINKADNILTGTVRGNYYKTDIVTKIDGKIITSYNVGGRTYIHGEEMANYGYIVKWSDIDRILSITSPEKAGYVYNIPMSYDKEKDIEGTGTFSITYNDGKITATDDADYFISNLYLNRDGYYHFDIKFYQHKALFYSTKLQNQLKLLAYSGFGIYDIIDPVEKFDDINNVIKFSINGQESKQIKIERGAGNGHIDYSLIVMDLPRYKKDEIKDFEITFGKSTGKPYDLIIPDYILNKKLTN